MQKCPDCHAQIDDEAIFCDQCGFQLKPKPGLPAAAPISETPLENPDNPIHVESSPRSCPICGYFNLPGETFCTNCGGQLSLTPGMDFRGEQSAGGARQPCPSCGAANPPGEAYCQVCGFALATSFQPTPAAENGSAPLSPDQVEPVEVQPAPSITPPSSSPFETIAAIPVPGRLHSPTTNFSLPLPRQVEIIIGRRDPEREIYPDVDLSAASLATNSDSSSVSRQHVRLLVQGNQIFIEDLNSTNSTFLNRQRLQPGQRYLLNHGDELRLGSVLLLFYTS